MGLQGEAVWALAVMWSLTGLVFAFLVLRLYTRVVFLAAYGVDDHIYVVAFVSDLRFWKTLTAPKKKKMMESTRLTLGAS